MDILFSFIDFNIYLIISWFAAQIVLILMKYNLFLIKPVFYCGDKYKVEWPVRGRKRVKLDKISWFSKYLKWHDINTAPRHKHGSNRIASTIKYLYCDVWPFILISQTICLQNYELKMDEVLNFLWQILSEREILKYIMNIVFTLRLISTWCLTRLT